MIRIERATERHARKLAATMRQADAEELMALGFGSPLEGIEESIRASVAAWAAFHGKHLLAIFGYSGDSIGMTVPWLLTSRNVDEHKIAFARASRMTVELMKAEVGRMENWVDARHSVCISWLQWLGFEVYAPQPIPPYGAMFRRFTMGA